MIAAMGSTRIRPTLGACLLAGCLVLFGCTSDATTTDPSPAEVATQASNGVSEAGSDDDLLSAGESSNVIDGVLWTERDQFDDTFGPGSAVIDLAALLPTDEDLPSTWFPFDDGPQEEEPACLGSVPVAAIETGWAALPTDDATEFDNIIFLEVAQHETPAAAEASVAFLGTEQWGECEASTLAGTGGTAAVMTSDNILGIEIPPVLDRPGVRTRRQFVQLDFIGSTIDLVGEVHRWSEGVVTFELFAASAEGVQGELATTLAAELGTWSPDLAGSALEAMTDKGVSELRKSIERNPEALQFYEMAGAALFRKPTLAETPSCRRGTELGLAKLVGPLWTTQTGSSAIIQHGVTFDNEQAAASELERLTGVAADCIVEDAKPTLGDLAVNQSSAEIRNVDGTELMFVTADLTQLATNDFLAVDIPVTLQLVVAQSDNSLVGFEFIGVTGDQPDMVELTLDALGRMGDS